jgi:protocatechuate 3,4-dioxygenase, beta subunit
MNKSKETNTNLEVTEETDTHGGVSRRGFAALMAATVTGAAGKAVAAACGLTPPQTEGPFYPITDQPDKDNDLTIVRGRQQQAKGRRIFILGQVLDENCQPVPGALVEIWQACISGRYNHSSDPNTAPLDPDFQYWGRSTTDGQGRYKFKTILPGSYPAAPGWRRPPHIHFKVQRLGFHELTTQMYFAGHPLNAQDRILQSLPQPQRSSVVVPLEDLPPTQGQGAKKCVFNLTLRAVRIR